MTARDASAPSVSMTDGERVRWFPLLAAGLWRAWKAGLDVRMHVHDEIVALVKTKLAEISASTLEEQMIEKPKWWGEDVPIRAKADVVTCYQK